MAFWDEHEGLANGSGGGYLTPDEKDALVDSEQPFEITGVVFEPDNKYGPRYRLSLSVPNPVTGENESRMVGFIKGSGVTSRDDLLQAMLDDHFDAGETTPIPAILAKGGNAYLIKPAA